MARQGFGPADSPAAANKLAGADLVRRLPAELCIDPVRRFNELAEMLKTTLQRDWGHLHEG